MDPYERPIRIPSPRDNEGYDVRDDMDKYEEDRESNAVGPDDDDRYDLGDIDQEPPEHYGDSVEDQNKQYIEDIAAAAKQYNTQFLFFMDALKRNGVL